MADVFISYAREDRPTVETLAEKLAFAGYKVWFDAELPQGRSGHRMAPEIEAARAVVVVWSKQSVVNPWVVAEAGEGRDTNRLVPVALEGVKPPMAFRDVETIDFTRWRNGEGEPFHMLLAILSKRAAPAYLPGAAKTPARKKRFGARMMVAVGAVALVVAAAGTVAFFFGPEMLARL